MVLHVFLFDKIKINSIQSFFFKLKSLVPFDNHIYFLTKAKSLENLGNKQLLYVQ